MALRSEYVAFLLKKEDEADFIEWLKSNAFNYERRSIGNFEDKVRLINVELPISGKKIIVEAINRKTIELCDKRSKEDNNEKS